MRVGVTTTPPITDDDHDDEPDSDTAQLLPSANTLYRTDRSDQAKESVERSRGRITALYCAGFAGCTPPRRS